jgi:rapamycin-insensitive companion of mTOR
LPGDIFPVAFARSLVAISNHKDDNLRRVCIETLRELSVENPRVVAMVNGLTTLLDVVLEPASQDMAEPILMSLLYLLNDPKSRYVDVFYHYLFLYYVFLLMTRLFFILLC